jgi:hypothetical protein
MADPPETATYPPNTTGHSETVEIDPAGDVRLEIGRESKSLLVSSKVLSLASSVFKAMFGPHFQEGNSLAQKYGY